MSLIKRLTGLIVLLATIAAVTTTGPINAGAMAESGVVTKPIEQVNAIEVELNDDYFNPKVITIPNGKTTTIKLKNTGKKEHTFTVEKLGVDAEVQPGNEKTITVTPKMPGTYELICRYHYQMGMVGQVIVK
jgi:plastocyanin